MRAGPAPLLRACHPEPTAAVTVVAVALAVAFGRSAAGVAAVGAAILAGQLSVGWSNDFIDRGRDVRAARGDKPLAVGTLDAAVVGTAAVTALAAALGLSLLSGLPAAAAHAGALALAWGYNLGLKRTPASVLTYAGAFALLPAFVTLGLTGHPLPPWWAVAGGALLGAGAHFANTLPDQADDVALGVRGLPQRLGPARSRRASAVLLLVASAVVALGPGRGGAAGAVAVAVLVLATVLVGTGVALERRAGSSGAFRMTMAVALLDVALLVVQAAVR